MSQSPSASFAAGAAAGITLAITAIRSGFVETPEGLDPLDEERLVTVLRSLAITADALHDEAYRIDPDPVSALYLVTRDNADDDD